MKKRAAVGSTARCSSLHVCALDGQGARAGVEVFDFSQDGEVAADGQQALAAAWAQGKSSSAARIRKYHGGKKRRVPLRC